MEETNMGILEIIGQSVQIVARNPPSILCALGGFGLLAGIKNAGVLLVLGVILQLAWLGRK